MVAADDVAVSRHEDALADGHPARREQLAVEADVRAFGELDVTVLARENRIPADEDAAGDANAAIALALASSRQLSSMSTLSPI